MKQRKIRLIFTISLLAILLITFGSSDLMAQKKLKVGIIQLLENPDFVAMREGFLMALKNKGYEVDTVFFNADIMNNPQDFVQKSKTAATDMLKQDVDIFFTPGMYHRIADSTGGKPIFDSSLYPTPATDKWFSEKGNKIYCTANATGTYLTYPFKEICQFTKEAMPKAKKIAYLFIPDSPVTRPTDEFQAEAKKYNLDVVPLQFANPKDFMEALKQAKANTDAAFIANDVFVISAHQQAIEFSINNKFPVITAIVPLVKGGAMAAFQLNWRRAGEMCGEKAIQVLNGTKANSIPVEKSDLFEMGFNLASAEKIGIPISYNRISLATLVVEK